MLNKEICKECSKLAPKHTHLGDPEKQFENNWAVGIVICRAGAVRPLRSVTGELPEYCPRRFEQLVAAGMEDES